MSQNIYDNPEFFAGYATLDRSVKGLDGAPEWPTIQAMLPSLQGKKYCLFWGLWIWLVFAATRAIIRQPV